MRGWKQLVVPPVALFSRLQLLGVDLAHEDVGRLTTVSDSRLSHPYRWVKHLPPFTILHVLMFSCKNSSKQFDMTVHVFELLLQENIQLQNGKWW